MSVNITTNLRLQVVKHLSHGKSLDVVAAITNLSRESVLDIGSHHGYPDVKKLDWAADILTKKVEEEATKATVTPGTSMPAPPRLVPSAPVPGPVVTAKPVDGLQGLLDFALGHQAARIRKAGERFKAEADKLRDLIREDSEKAKLKEEVARLEAQLKAARAKLRPTSTSTAPAAAPRSSEPSAKEVRAWAAENGVECTTTGRVASHVVEAYLAAKAS